LFAGPLPLVRAAVAAGFSTGPVLLADGEVVWGLVALAVGAPIVLLGSRALLSLVRRWAVLVPAGLVVVDPMTLTDSVLVQRRQLRTLRARGGGDVPPDALDLRLGATVGTIGIELHQPIDVSRAERGRRSRVERSAVILIAVVQRRRLLEAGAARAYAAIAPPTSSSPS
jgi:hypothetical protein